MIDYIQGCQSVFNARVSFFEDIKKAWSSKLEECIKEDLKKRNLTLDLFSDPEKIYLCLNDPAAKTRNYLIAKTIR